MTYGLAVTDPGWMPVHAMKPALLEVWLGTCTDAERDALSRSESPVLLQVGLVAERLGFSPEKVAGVTVQSEETVARDFAGSWFYALR